MKQNENRKQNRSLVKLLVIGGLVELLLPVVLAAILYFACDGAEEIGFKMLWAICFLGITILFPGASFLIF